MLIIKKSFDFEEFEIALRLAKKERQLRLPTQFNHIGYWGIDVALIQLLVTWARAHETAEIKTYIEDADPIGRNQQLSDLGMRLFGIAALYLAKKVVTAQGTPIPKEEYARHCSNVLKAMDEANIHSSASVNLTYPRSVVKVAAQFICLHGSKFEFLHSLYHAPSRDDAINRIDFSFLVKSAFDNHAQFGAYLKSKPELQIGLSNLLQELFQNTNDHGYEDLDGASFTSNVRAFSIKSHSQLGSHEQMKRLKSSNTEFNEYLEFCAELFSSKGLKSHRFLELSMVDGGLGYAQRFSGKPLSELTLEDEKRITMDCFKRGVSSKRSQSRGEGLDNVWKALCELHGFIRLRTGRLSLFHAFHNKTVQDERSFSLWTKTELEAVSGSAVTIIIPCVF